MSWPNDSCFSFRELFWHVPKYFCLNKDTYRYQPNFGRIRIHPNSCSSLESHILCGQILWDDYLLFGSGQHIQKIIKYRSATDEQKKKVTKAPQAFISWWAQVHIFLTFQGCNSILTNLSCRNCASPPSGLLFHCWVAM